MTNLEMAQKNGWKIVKQLEDGRRVDVLIIGLLQTCVELLAAIADKMDIPNAPMATKREDE